MLRRIFRLSGRSPTNIRRTLSARYSSAPCEIVTCRFDDSTTARMFCKYAIGGDAVTDGVRNGLRYEGAVYRLAIAPAPFTTPEFFGIHTDRKSGITCLAIEYLSRAITISQTERDRGFLLAARWLGSFHAYYESRGDRLGRGTLKRYDRSFYRGWPVRAKTSNRWHGDFPWLSGLCDALESVLPRLADFPQTIIHGEFYPHNVLFLRGAVWPIDWESAALAPGEIDLAMLVEGYSQADRRRAIDEYKRARWPSGAPKYFDEVFDYARLYLAFRWLGALDYQEVRPSLLRSVEKVARKARLI